VGKFLITGTTLASIARRLCQSELVPNAGGVLVSNPAYGLLTPIEEPTLDDFSTTAWYVACDPNIIPAIEVPFLDGKQEPETLLLDAKTVNLTTGATELMDFVYEEIRYKSIINKNNPNEFVIFYYIPKDTHIELKKREYIRTITCLNGILELDINGKLMYVTELEKVILDSDTWQGKALENTYVLTTN
jgi:hypothetical protein